MHTLPALAAIHSSLPSAEISWVVKTHSAEILRENHLIGNLIEVDTRSLRGGMSIEDILLDVTRQVKALRRFTFDVALDFQGLLKSAMIAKLSGAGSRWGFSREGLREPAARFAMTDTAAIEPHIHVIRKNLELARAALRIAVPDSDFEFPISTSEEHKAEAAKIAGEAGGQFALLNPAGGWVTKLWHAEKFGQLADRLWEEKGLASIVATGPDETPLADAVRKSSKTDKIILSQPSLKGFFELAKQTAVYVGGDTGPTHLAVAAGASVVGLFGPTEWWRNGSPNPDDVCVERTDIGCRVECHRRTCSNWICMDSDVDTVYRAVGERLAKTSLRSNGLSTSG